MDDWLRKGHELLLMLRCRFDVWHGGYCSAQGRAEAGQPQALLILVKLGAPTSEATRPWPLMTFLHSHNENGAAHESWMPY